MGERGRLEKFVGNTYAPMLKRKPVKALIMGVFLVIFVSAITVLLVVLASQRLLQWSGDCLLYTSPSPRD